jgi:hypothetical protein
MLSYFYKCMPLIIVTGVVILSMPWLGLIALMIVTIVALAALAWAVVFVPSMLGRAMRHRRHMPSGASPRTAPALPPAWRRGDSAWRGAPLHPVTLRVARELQAPQHTSAEGYLP